MIIAKEKKKTNIVEYVLYMWQIEDLLRSFDLDFEKIKDKIIAQFDVDNTIKEEIEVWYQGLIEQMKEEQKQKKGHLQFIQNIINELNDLHLYLIEKKNADYLQLYSWAKTHIDELHKLSKKTTKNDIESALNGLYGYLLLKLKKREVTKETQESINSISKMMAMLNRIYFQIEKGEMEITTT
jgi:flagellin-specific chaperone FliS